MCFLKVTNQLVNVCKDYLSELAVVHNSEEYFWPNIFKEIEENYSVLSSPEIIDSISNPTVNYSSNFSFTKSDWYLKKCLKFN